MFVYINALKQALKIKELKSTTGIPEVESSDTTVIIDLKLKRYEKRSIQKYDHQP